MTYLERISGSNWYKYNDLEVYLLEEINRQVCSDVRRLLIGKLTKKGKKMYAYKVYEQVLYKLKKERKKEPLFIIIFAVLNCLLEFRFIRKRMGGQKKEIPLPISLTKQVQTAVTKIIDFSLTGKRTTVNIDDMVKILLDSSEFKGVVIKDNFRIYKNALDNKILIKYLK